MVNVQKVKIKKNERPGNPLFLRDKVNRDRIDAVAGVFCGEPFSQENMPQVTAAVGTDDFGPHSVGIRDPLNRSFNVVIKAGPSAVDVEFVV